MSLRNELQTGHLHLSSSESECSAEEEKKSSLRVSKVEVNTQDSEAERIRNDPFNKNKDSMFSLPN